MVREFQLPDVGEGVSEGEIVRWLVEEGDAVTEDQSVAEVETDKALVEVPSPVDGTVREIRAEEGEVVPVGTVIITFDEEGVEAEPAADETAEPAEGAASASADSEEAEPAGRETTGDPEATGADSSGPGGRVFASPSVRRLARELGIELDAVEGSGPGGRVTEGDVRAAAESSDDPDERAKALREAEEPLGGEHPSTASETQPTTEDANRDRTLAAPATRRIAEEEGVDIDAVPVTEERDGEAFVTPEAVREYAEAQRRAQEADAERIATGETGEREEREPFRGVRRRIAERMSESKFTAPHVTHHDEADVTELVETRTELKEVAADRGIRLTYMPFVLKAVTAALKEFPEVNSQLDEENEELVVKRYYNLGVATATDAGLMVPVIEDVDRKGLLQLASEMNELVEKCRERSIGPEELQGGTFTVTNVGGIGGEYATPIINYPEVAILAMGEIKEKPRVVDGDIVPRHVLTLSLSFDHRVIDGADGARFTNAVKRYLKNPSLLLLE